MATFFSENAFNVTTLDFNEPFREPHSTTQVGSGSLPFNLPSIDIGSATYDLPSHTFAFSGGTRVVWGGIHVAVIAGDGFAYGASGELVAGTATVLVDLNNNNMDFAVVGFSASAVAFAAASQTASNVDDIALFNQIFTGNDLITLSAFNDVFNSGAGQDLIYDQGGNDKINAGSANDFVLSGKGIDRVDAGTGNDVVMGGAGNDRIDGGIGADMIWAGTGSDTVTGGAGADAFLFKSGDGAATITDFNAADDQILFMGPGSTLANLSIVRDGANLRITFSDVTVILLNTLRSEVTPDDIATGGNAALATAADAFFLNWDYA